MLSITECKKKLNKNGVHFSDFEIEKIRNVLYKMAQICHKQITKKQNEKR
jgi:hypothetical protein